ncbi:hypothetical protein A4X13_0g6886 [Tilletia indica]|uniref:Uncharacterized protein n=1 Tax=Tilletia indica TaxID=43049 RepID=A0A177T7V2_9BASI|nr:hypothetical protein A4X13_0g6886 [Tilletia indica]
MVSAEDRRLQLKRQDELKERERLSSLGETTESARIDLERTRTNDVRYLEERNLTQAESKEAFEREYRQAERERDRERERREERWREKEFRKEERRRDREQKAKEAGSRREERRRDKEERRKEKEDRRERERYLMDMEERPKDRELKRQDRERERERQERERRDNQKRMMMLQTHAFYPMSMMGPSTPMPLSRAAPFVSPQAYPDSYPPIHSLPYYPPYGYHQGPSPPAAAYHPPYDPRQASINQAWQTNPVDSPLSAQYPTPGPSSASLPPTNPPTPHASHRPQYPHSGAQYSTPGPSSAGLPPTHVPTTQYPYRGAQPSTPFSRLLAAVPPTDISSSTSSWINSAAEAGAT